jgi:4-hydroxyphenylpyruvate dioxygenase
VLQFVSYQDDEGGEDEELATSTTSSRVPILPHLSPVEGKMAERSRYGIYKINHAVGNVHNLQETYDRIKKFTGFHEFAEFTSEDVGTVDSGLNLVLLASDSKAVLWPLNEPIQGK